METDWDEGVEKEVPEVDPHPMKSANHEEMKVSRTKTKKKEARSMKELTKAEEASIKRTDSDSRRDRISITKTPTKTTMCQIIQGSPNMASSLTGKLLVVDTRIPTTNDEVEEILLPLQQPITTTLQEINLLRTTLTVREDMGRRPTNEEVPCKIRSMNLLLRLTLTLTISRDKASSKLEPTPNEPEREVLLRLLEVQITQTITLLHKV